jgi:hypothetical protein
VQLCGKLKKKRVNEDESKDPLRVYRAKKKKSLFSG